MRKFALIITVLMLTMASCDNKKYDIVGVWGKTEGKMTASGRAELSSSITTFKDDGHYEGIVFVKTAHLQTEMGELGNYEIVKDTIIKRPTCLTAGGESISVKSDMVHKWRIIKLDEKTLTYETNGKTYELTKTSNSSDTNE